MHTILSYRGNRPTYTQTNQPTHPHTDRTDYNTLCCSFASAQCKQSQINQNTLFNIMLQYKIQHFPTNEMPYTTVLCQSSINYEQLI